MEFTNVLTRRLGIEYPLIQAPMAGVSTPQLAAAVSNAGALGSLGLGAGSVEQAREAIRATRALTERPFNVNFFCHRPAHHNPEREQAWLEYLQPFFKEFGATPPARLTLIYRSFDETPDMLSMLLEERPAVVSFHFGLPPEAWIRQLRDAGMVILACVTNLDEARQAEAAGVDAIVAQGIEAGGHRGVFEPGPEDPQLGLMPLLRLLRERCRLPLIAAGGIMDGVGISAALTLGASAVQLGTAFLLTPESATNAGYRDAIRRAGETGLTRITRAISGRPARAIVNRMHTDIDRPEAPPVPDYPVAYDAGKALAAAAGIRGCHAFAAHWAGQGVARARAMPAAELVQLLMREYQCALQEATAGTGTGGFGASQDIGAAGD